MIIYAWFGFSEVCCFLDDILYFLYVVAAILVFNWLKKNMNFVKGNLRIILTTSYLIHWVASEKKHFEVHLALLTRTTMLNFRSALTASKFSAEY